MKKQLFLFGCALGLTLVPAKAQDDKEHTPLGKQMESMNDAYKAFRKETDPVKGAALARDAQQAALKAAAETPALIKDLPEGPDKLKAAVEYRKMMGKLFISLCEVEEAFNNGKVEDVAKIVASLKDMKKEGHEKFVKED
ncbi:MAG: cytochrome b562 [Luteolibacter sp.]